MDDRDVLLARFAWYDSLRGTRLPVVNDRFWERLQFNGGPYKEHLFRTSMAWAQPWQREFLWRNFKLACAQQGNFLPRFIYRTQIQTPPQPMFQRRRPRGKRKGCRPSDGLPFPQWIEAEHIFERLCKKWEGDLPSWRRAILVGVARRLAMHPPDSAWGKRMRRIKGGVHCQRKYRESGTHPLPNVRQAIVKAAARQRAS